MAIARQLLAAVLVGVFVSVWRGISMLDPFFFLPFACLSAVLAGPMMIARTRSAFHIAARACVTMALIVAISLVAMNYPWNETWYWPEWAIVVDAVLLSFGCALAAACSAALIKARWNANVAKWSFRLFALAALIAWREAPLSWSNSAIVATLNWGLSTTALTAAAALLLADVALLQLLKRSADMAPRIGQSAASGNA